jgi:hypothetical protein
MRKRGKKEERGTKTKKASRIRVTRNEGKKERNKQTNEKKAERNKQGKEKREEKSTQGKKNTKSNLTSSSSSLIHLTTYFKLR